jgi:hypothetical protein
MPRTNEPIILNLLAKNIQKFDLDEAERWMMKRKIAGKTGKSVKKSDLPFIESYSNSKISGELVFLGPSSRAGKTFRTSKAIRNYRVCPFSRFFIRLGKPIPDSLVFKDFPENCLPLSLFFHMLLEVIPELILKPDHVGIFGSDQAFDLPAGIF